MPRETIIRGALLVATPVNDTRDPGPGLILDLYHGGPIPGGSNLVHDADVDVAWDRDGEVVQIGFTLSRERWLEVADMLREQPDITAHAEYTAPVSRAEINHTIRTLKRARDAAYGADE